MFPHSRSRVRKSGIEGNNERYSVCVAILFSWFQTLKKKCATRLIPLELIHTNRDSVRKAREAHLIDKAKTLEPQGLNRRDELH